MELSGEIDEVENVLLETRTAESDRGLEEFGADAGILSAGICDFVYVCACGLADGGQGVDTGDSLRKKCIRGLKGQNITYKDINFI